VVEYLSCRKTAPQLEKIKALKKFQKTFEKGIDKVEEMWYNNRVAAKKATVTNEELEKRLKKN
jgi:hypothetical protein